MSPAPVGGAPRKSGRLLLACLMGLVVGCTDPPPQADDPAPGDVEIPGDPAEDPAAHAPTEQTLVFFTRDESPHPVDRLVTVLPADDEEDEPDPSGMTATRIESTLEALLRGPTPQERGEGISSFFSEETASFLESVVLDGEGLLVVDFRDFSRIIPGASSSAGSRALLGELGATVFQFRGVEAVEYRFEGSCDRFWNWLQRDCRVVERSPPEETNATAPNGE